MKLRTLTFVLAALMLGACSKEAAAPAAPTASAGTAAPSNRVTYRMLRITVPAK